MEYRRNSRKVVKSTSIVLPEVKEFNIDNECHNILSRLNNESEFNIDIVRMLLCSYFEAIVVNSPFEFNSSYYFLFGDDDRLTYVSKVFDEEFKSLIEKLFKNGNTIYDIKYRIGQNNETILVVSHIGYNKKEKHIGLLDKLREALIEKGCKISDMALVATIIIYSSVDEDMRKERNYSIPIKVRFQHRKDYDEIINIVESILSDIIGIRLKEPDSLMRINSYGGDVYVYHNTTTIDYENLSLRSNDEISSGIPNSRVLH